MGLLSHDIVAWSIVAHFEFKDDLVGIKCMRCAKYLDCHDLLHSLSLVSRKALIVLGNLQVGLMRQVEILHQLVAILGQVWHQLVGTFLA